MDCYQCTLILYSTTISLPDLLAHCAVDQVDSVEEVHDVHGQPVVEVLTLGQLDNLSQVYTGV